MLSDFKGFIYAPVILFNQNHNNSLKSLQNQSEIV